VKSLTITYPPQNLKQQHERKEERKRGRKEGRKERRKEGSKEGGIHRRHNILFESMISYPNRIKDVPPVSIPK